MSVGRRVRKVETWRAAVRPVAWVTAGLAGCMAGCALLGNIVNTWLMEPRDIDQGSATAMLAAAIVTLVGAALLWSMSEANDGLGRRQATLSVALIWLATGVFGSLPYLFDARLAPADGLFEAVSGFTTTGATILSDIEGTASRTLLLWRSLTQWLGGMGIVVLFVAVFPSVGVGGRHLFRGEVPGPTSEGLVPRIRETSVQLWKLYTMLTLIQIAVMWLLGVGMFDAVCHSMTTLSTGGFSTYDASAAGLDSVAVEVAMSVFMLLAGVNFALYYSLFASGSIRSFLRSTELRVYAAVVAVFTITMAFAILPRHGNFLVSLQKSFFMVATTITSTGYGNGEDYMAYPGTGLALILLMMFVGGMAGSTAGGFKIVRVTLLIETAWAQLRSTFRPSVVQVIRMDGKAVPNSVLSEVGAFTVVYFAAMALGILLVTVTDGVSPQTAFGAMLTSLSNMGPAPYYQGSDNFASYSSTAKVVFCGSMVLGRLEFFTLLALLLPDFWSSFHPVSTR